MENLKAIKYLLKDYKKWSKQRGLIWEISFEDFLEITSSRCHYCGVEPIKKVKAYPIRDYDKPYYYNGIDRVDNELGYVNNNVVACCTICNYGKRCLSYDEFIKYTHRVCNFILMQ